MGSSSVNGIGVEIASLIVFDVVLTILFYFSEILAGFIK
jgi:hypothetical protein